jgi:uncharacterized coiled-coil protein SlyX
VVTTPAPENNSGAETQPQPSASVETIVELARDQGQQEAIQEQQQATIETIEADQANQQTTTEILNSRVSNLEQAIGEVSTKIELLVEAWEATETEAEAETEAEIEVAEAAAENNQPQPGRVSLLRRAIFGTPRN